MTPGIDGRILRRGDDEYEQARRATVWNARTPDRFPDVIVQAQTEDDVVGAVHLAREEGHRIGIRSGGHSWAGNHVRDGGMLLDVSRMREAAIDAPAMSATVQPGCPGNELLGLLAEHDRFFPAGHCMGVCVGGYLLQGGYGWNGRVHGPACQSVQAIDVVTADGELVHADEDQNADLLWAARGSGPGFFGVVTRFHLRLYPRPNFVANALYLYPRDCIDEVFTWAREIGPDVSPNVELMLILHRDEQGEVELAVTGPTIVDTEEQARRALAILATCPARDRAKQAFPFVETQLPELYAGVQLSYPDHHRYGTDNMWTHAPIEQLLPGIHRIADTLPPAPSHMLWMNWGARTGPSTPPRVDMAYSVEDDIYIALYGVWQDAGDDGAIATWAEDRMREMEPLATGIQLADENLGRRPARFVTDDHMARLDSLRATYDPDGRFHPWMGRI